MIQVDRYKVIGFFLSVVVGFLSMLQPKMIQIENQRQEIHDLSLKIEANQQWLADKAHIEQRAIELTHSINKYPIQNLFAVMLHFYQGALLSNLFVQLIKPYTMGSTVKNNSRVVKMTMIGKLTQLNAFFYQLTQLHLPIEMKNFSLHKIENDHWKMLLYFTVFNSDSSEGYFKEQIKDHFSDEELLGLFPIEQIQYVGLMTNQQQQWAIVKLPNDQTLSIQEGSIVGVEKARVTFISNDKLMLQDQQKNIFSILYQKGST